jgi:hypothetical protein
MREMGTTGVVSSLPHRLVDCGLVSDDCDVFASVLVSSKKLKHLDIACNYLEEGLRSLCRALCHPDCTLSLLV